MPKVDLSVYDDLECPHCDSLTKPYQVNKNESVSYYCLDCSDTFTISVNGELIED